MVKTTTAACVHVAERIPSFPHIAGICGPQGRARKVTLEPMCLMLGAAAGLDAVPYGRKEGQVCVQG